MGVVCVVGLDIFGDCVVGVVGGVFLVVLVVFGCGCFYCGGDGGVYWGGFVLVLLGILLGD